MRTTALSGACAVRMRVPGNGRVSSWRLRLLLPILLICPVCPLVLQGCAGLAVAESTATVDWQPPANVPMTIRTLNADGRFSEISSVAAAERLRALHPGEPFNILALSGGGAYGAFGAGAVAGLTHTGSRPDFTVVTGVSVGALIAPYAFLGPTWDADLLDVFTSAPGEEHLLQSRGLAGIFGSSLYSGRPLQHLVGAHLSDTMIQAIAREAQKGRLLLVATTDVVTGMPVLWDLGAIAQNGGPNARTLLRDVLVASASVPGLFPPVMIRVNKDGVTHDEAHVDGYATMPFLVPPAFMQTPPDARGTNHTAVYVIIDGPLGDPPKTTRLTTRAILSRSINAGLNQMLLTTLELTAVTAQLQGATLQYSAVPITHARGDPYDFRADMMTPLSRYAYECAQAKRLWTPFGRTDDSIGASRGIAETQEVPCPADDASIRYFAARGDQPQRTASKLMPINH